MISYFEVQHLVQPRTSTSTSFPLTQIASRLLLEAFWSFYTGIEWRYRRKPKHCHCTGALGSCSARSLQLRSASSIFDTTNAWLRLRYLPRMTMSFARAPSGDAVSKVPTVAALQFSTISFSSVPMSPAPLSQHMRMVARYHPRQRKHIMLR